MKWVAKHCYGLDSIKGLRIDIWGDGMARGRRDVVRFCFRILGTEYATFCTNQSRKHAFAFAVFIGKDSRCNMELNMMSFDIIGEPGWLFLQSKELVEQYEVRFSYFVGNP